MKTPTNAAMLKNQVHGKSLNSLGPLFAADVDEESKTKSVMENEDELEARNLSFTRNPRGLTGSTSDEDGKSNIWSTGDKNEKEIDENSNPTVVLGALGIGLIAMVYGIAQLNFVSGDI